MLASNRACEKTKERNTSERQILIFADLFNSTYFRIAKKELIADA